MPNHAQQNNRNWKPTPPNVVILILTVSPARQHTPMWYFRHPFPPAFAASMKAMGSSSPIRNVPFLSGPPCCLWAFCTGPCCPGARPLSPSNPVCRTHGNQQPGSHPNLFVRLMAKCSQQKKQYKGGPPTKLCNWPLLLGTDSSAARYYNSPLVLLYLCSHGPRLMVKHGPKAPWPQNLQRSGLKSMQGVTGLVFLKNLALDFPSPTPHKKPTGVFSPCRPLDRGFPSLNESKPVMFPKNDHNLPSYSPHFLRGLVKVTPPLLGTPPGYDFLFHPEDKKRRPF